MKNGSQYRAPFGPAGEHPVDEVLCRRLLDVALKNGGDYADIFFEYHASGGLTFSEGILKAASRGVSMGVGVRVQRRGATGHAYTEDLSFDAVQRAAKTVSQIALGGGGSEAVALAFRPVPRRYEVETGSLDVPLGQKRSLCERAASAALYFDRRITAAESSFTEDFREILVATSDGVVAHDAQPLFRFLVRAMAQSGRSSQEGSSGGGGRTGLSYFLHKPPEWHGQEAAWQAVLSLDCRDGDFIMGMKESYLIEDGELPAPLVPRNIIGNSLDMLGNITMLGSDVTISDGIWTSGKENQNMPVGVGCPTMKIETLLIG